MHATVTGTLGNCTEHYGNHKQSTHYLYIYIGYRIKYKEIQRMWDMFNCLCKRCDCMHDKNLVFVFPSLSLPDCAELCKLSINLCSNSMLTNYEQLFATLRYGTISDYAKVVQIFVVASEIEVELKTKGMDRYTIKHSNFCI